MDDMRNLILSKNKSYWNNFYKSKISKSLVGNSNFANFTLNIIKNVFYSEDILPTKTLLDIGCGNGRDTYYFRDNGIEANGIDLSCNINLPYFRQIDALSLLEKHDIYYLRFFLHTLEEHQMNQLMKNLLESMSDESYIFIETRSTHGITDLEKSETNFCSKIGKNHFRMLYSHHYLEEKFKKDFKIIFSMEDIGFAPFRGEDPFTIRMILAKK
jgi:SAM-dependent methyltransferase